MDVPVLDFTGDREQRDRSVVLCIRLNCSQFLELVPQRMFSKHLHGNFPVVIKRFDKYRGYIY